MLSQYEVDRRLAVIRTSKTGEEAANILGIHKNIVYQMMSDHGIVMKKKQEIEERKIRIADMYKRGLSDSAIADIEGVDRGVVYKWRASRGYPPNPGSVLYRKPKPTRIMPDSVREYLLSSNHGRLISDV